MPPINLLVDGFGKRTVIAGGTQLRILPLGASITVGFQSSDGNGYRLGLLNRLAGSNVEYIGTVRAGTMTDVSPECCVSILSRLIRATAELE